jgi:hypothetical protein
MADESLHWIAAAERQIQLGAHGAALPYLHKVFLYAAKFSSVRAHACLKLADACRSVGQPFIGAEFLREAESIALAVPTLKQQLSTELSATARLFTDGAKLEHDFSNLIARVTQIWHRIGIPFAPAKENLRLLNVHRVDQPTPYFSNITWACLLPVYALDSSEPALQALLTTFDVNLGPHVMQRFERTLEFLEADQDLHLLSAETSPTLAFTLRIPKADIPALKEIAGHFLASGVPLALLENAPRTQNGDGFVKAGLSYASQGADLFALALLREAGKVFQAAGDNKGRRLASLNEALTMQRLGYERDATAVALSVYNESKRVQDIEIAEAINAAFPEWFDQDRAEAVLTELNERKKPLVVAGKRPFVLDESSGKVLKGMFASEALAEFEGSRLLIEAWTEEFPGVTEPFSRCLLPRTFDWEDPSFLADSPSGKLELGQLDRLMPIDGTLRLGDAATLEIPKGHTPELYAAEFATRVFSALLVAHKRLDGAYSSGAGTSISLGNVSTRGHVFDYETFRSPRMGDTEDLRPAQIQDLCNAVKLTHAFLQKLQRVDLMADLMTKVTLIYSQYEDVKLENMDHIKRIAGAGNDLSEHRTLVTEFAHYSAAPFGAIGLGSRAQGII